MKCLIIAAGQGTRLSGVGESKPLIPLLSKPLIVRVIETAREAGVTEFYIVTGYKAGKIVEALLPYSMEKGVPIHFIANDEWQKQNGISVLKAQGVIKDPFFLLMSDHLFDAEILKELAEEATFKHNTRHDVILAVDTRLKNNPLVDLEDVTKVQAEAGNIIDIGKTIPAYNAFDTGIFYCTPYIFNALTESIKRGDSSLSGGIRVLAERGKAGVMDIGNAFWLDVDNEEMLQRAEILLNNKD
jgi:choline kinase